ncbi:MAG: bifunctional RNase H/acid phosphatase [Actinobacteria bacterium]|nr:bifunctional RNase H/acid phosphatase [Actinomycetota bacterium]
MARHFIMTADGGSRGNPGPAGYGAVVHEGNVIVAELYDYIGIATNNVSEYSGLIAGLKAIHEIDPNATIDVRMDSKLVVEQMSGRWQIKHADMRTLAKEAREAHEPTFVTYTWIPREENAHADRLANKALDDRNGSVPQPKNLLLERLRMAEVPTMIYFVRHGETVLTPDRKFSGSAGPNPELTVTGKDQAQRVAVEAIKLGAELLIASPLRRTAETAALISLSTGMEIIFDEAWYECDFGLWDGMSIDEVKTAYPKEYQKWVSSTSFAPLGGESYEALGWRVDEAIDKLVAKYPGRKIVVVTHNGVIKQAIRLALGAHTDSIFHMDVAPCSITSLSIWPSDGLRALRSANEQGHLR